jgi:hypothetical protein
VFVSCAGAPKEGAVGKSTPFTYESLTDNIAAEFRDVEERWRGLERETTAGLLDIGRRLVGAKGLVEPGKFTAFVKDRLGIEERTAEHDAGRGLRG